MINKCICLALCAVALSGCGAVNAWVSSAESVAVADAAGAANNVHTANVAAAGLWARAACGLTLGGLAGSGSAALTEAAMKLCTPAGVTIGGITAPSSGTLTGDPFAAVAPAK